MPTIDPTDGIPDPPRRQLTGAARRSGTLVPPGLARCPDHPEEGWVEAADETQTRILGNLWLSRQPAARITYQCGLSVRVEWPTEWNQTHPDYQVFAW